MRKNILISVLSLFFLGCKSNLNEKPKGIDYLAEYCLRQNEPGFLLDTYDSYAIYSFSINSVKLRHITYILTIKRLDTISIASVKSLYYRERAGFGTPEYVDSSFIEVSNILPVDSLKFIDDFIDKIIDDSANYKPIQNPRSNLGFLYYHKGGKKFDLSVETVGLSKMNQIDSLFLTSKYFLSLDSNINSSAKDYLIRNNVMEF